MALKKLILAFVIGSFFPQAWAFSVSEEPYASVLVLRAKYQPLVDYLGQHSERTHYLACRDYAEYVSKSKSHAIDIAFASSGLAQLLVDRFGYEAVLASDNTLNAVVFVPASSTVRRLEDLHTGSIIAPKPNDIVAVLADRLIGKRGLDPLLRPRMVQADKVDHIIMAVLSGKHAAGIVAGYDLDLVDPMLRTKLRIVDRSESVTAHYVLLRPGLPPELRNKLIRVLQEFHGSQEGKAYAESFGSSRFLPVTKAQQQELSAFQGLADLIGGNH